MVHIVFCILLFCMPYGGMADSLGVCLREVFFGQDVYEPYTPSERILSKHGSRRPTLRERSTGDGLETLIAANGGFINLSDFFNGKQPAEAETSSAKPTETALPTTESTSSEHETSSGASSEHGTSSGASSEHGTSSGASSEHGTSSETSPEHETSSEASSEDQTGTTGSPSQEPDGKSYTCKSEFIDFSQRDAMSKFSFVWCPQNAIQTENSVKWVLTQSCGTTMVYPWDFRQGRIEARIRIGAGSGVVTALLLLGPPPSDEIDFEWVGKDTTSVQTMYYYQAHRVVAMPLVFTVDQPNEQDLSTTFQNYAIELHEDKVEWFFNGKSIRVLQKENKYFPADATRARMGIWDGSQTSGWAGTVDWSQGQFTAEMQWFNFTPFC